MRRYLHIMHGMRRRPNTLVSLEASILAAAVGLKARGAHDFHGFLIAREIRDRQGARLLTAHGTLYRALDRLQRAGLLESEWEDPALAAAAGRPRRRLYRVTAAGEGALAKHNQEAGSRPDLRQELAPQ